MALTRPEPLWAQIAADVRGKIASGDYAPGAKIPSETEMVTEYGVSRSVARRAVTELRAEGLITVHHGQGAYVRQTAAATQGLERGITRTGTGAKARYSTPDGYAEAEEPSRYRTTTDTTTGPLLGADEGEAAFGTDRLITHEASGARLLHRVVLPFETADGTPLEQDPHQAPAAVYDALAAAGYTLTWTEQVTARMPAPDEASTLRIAVGVPVLVIRRITHGTRDGATRPLLYEETRAAADTVHAEYRVTADTRKAARI